ncbi:MAG TPA: alanine--tRNA ligase [Kofleriaceae bacterium]|nr:alanine--tRNA ligase [Kofleriaceae bacterium]
MKAADVRKAFLEFFAAQRHEVVSSSALVPANDPTLLFTNAGMVQFKDVFTGAEKRGYKRATTSQKCVRAGGKHNDLDEVGKTPRHHTFFEMLGNFSFGDYFKEDAVAWAWKLLTEVYGIDKDRLCITVFGGDKSLGVGPDDEARNIWKNVTGFGDDRIIGLGVKDNFWMMGDTGPMGPCTEIHYFVDSKPGEKPRPPTSDPATWPGWLEIWNLVFMQFERRTAGGELFTLPAPSIDTGAGLERVTAVMNGKKSNYETDLFVPLLQTAAALAKKTYGDHAESDTSMRVIADHARCASFLIADGVFPDKTGREYVLRRIFRRAVRHGKLLGITEPFMHRVCAKVVEEMSGQYPELAERSSIITEVALEEEKRFRATLDRGLAMLDHEFAELDKAGTKKLPGQTVFTLYDTFGFPDDLTEIVAGERGFTIDKGAFDDAMAKAKELSKFGGSDQEAVSGIYKSLANELSTTFTGYESLGGEGKLTAVIVDGERAEHASVGATVALVFDQTSFYAESGGQTGDAGVVTAVDGSCEIEITDTKKPAGSMHVLFGTVKRGTVSLRAGTSPTYRFAVDGVRRDRIRANHSATHLLHLALKKYCGDHVAQKGSLVSADRLRFDFAHFSPMTHEQRRNVEDFVNAEIRNNRDSQIEVLPIEAAKQKGAVAMFGEKYGDTVRVVSIGNESLEFCGGTHVRRAGDIGLFKLVSESGVAQGVRRIEAVTGISALEYVRRVEDELAAIGDKLKSNPLESAARVEKLLADAKLLEKEIEKLKGKIASGGGGRDLMAETVTIKDIKVLAVAVEVDDLKVLRDTGDQLRDKLGSGVLVLAGTSATGDIKLIAMVTKDLTARVNAGKLLAAVAEKLGGRAGGKPDMAQGGGKDVAALPAALETARAWVQENA